jgi:hypothetical protein
LASWAGSRIAQTSLGRNGTCVVVIPERSVGLESMPASRGAVKLTEPDCHQFVTIGGGFRPFGALSSGSARRKDARQVRYLPGILSAVRRSENPGVGGSIPRWFWNRDSASLGASWARETVAAAHVFTKPSCFGRAPSSFETESGGPSCTVQDHGLHAA